MKNKLRGTITSDANNIILFVHGFGVRWDSRGMFTDITKILPRNWGSVLFDFYQVDNNTTYVTTFDDQVTKLKEIYTTVSKQHPKAKIHIIAHSMGCIVTAIANLPINGKALLIAPPESFSTRIKEYFESVPGSKYETDYLIVPRKDGTTTYIPSHFFGSLQSISPEKAMVSLAETCHVEILQATKDEVIGKTSYSHLKENPKITVTGMPADHNFSGEFRIQLIKFIKNELEIHVDKHSSQSYRKDVELKDSSSYEHN